MKIEDFKFIVESEPSLLNFNEHLFFYSKVVLIDSIFDFFPYGKFYFLDDHGIIYDTFNYVEGLKLNIKMGIEENGYLEHSFGWSGFDMVDIEIQDYLSGNVVFDMLSYPFVKNVKYRKSYRDTIKNIVTEIVRDIYEVTDTTKLHISNTTGTSQWNMYNQRPSIFIQNLTNRAYDQSFEKMGFITFMNLKGEFYFQHLRDLLEQTELNTDAPIYLALDNEGSFKSNIIQDYTLEITDSDINSPVRKVYTGYIKKDGSIVEEDSTLVDYIYKRNDEKVSFRNDYLNQGSEIKWYDFYDEDEDQNAYKGFKNANFKQALFPTRIRVILPFNKDYVSGKVLKLEIGSNFESKANKLKELSGKWLILESKHFVDFDKVPITEVLLGKSGLYIDRTHSLFSDFS